MERKDKLALYSLLCSCLFFLVGVLWPQAYVEAGGRAFVIAGGTLCLGLLACSMFFGIAALRCRNQLRKRKLTIAATIAWGLALGATLYVLYPRSFVSFAYESGAVSTLRSISSAEEVYHKRYGRYASLGQLKEEKLIGANLAAATVPERARSRYYFIHAIHQNSWSCVAIPVEPGPHHSRTFYIDQAGSIRYAPYESMNSPPANSKSPHLVKKGSLGD